MSYIFDNRRLVLWFNQEKRDLPWRDSPTPYRVWISEVMLQQTQVAVVIPYFERWMQLFPTIEALAQAPLDEAIKAWEGLGYYSRVRNLHAGAKYIVERYQGTLPDTAEDLKKIKGLGPYTIGAILSFAFHQKATAVDGNVVRLLTRYFNLHDDISKPKTLLKIRQITEDILPEKEPWVFNEALIELGAKICTRIPKCSDCPIKASCSGHKNQTASTLPYKSKKVEVESIYRTVAVIYLHNKFLIKREEKGKIMSDLHEFPYFNTSPKGLSDKQLCTQISHVLNLETKKKKYLETVNHSFTRYRVKLYPILLECKQIREVQGYAWKSMEEIQSLAFSSGHKKILSAILDHIRLNQ